MKWPWWNAGAASWHLHGVHTAKLLMRVYKIATVTDKRDHSAQKVEFLISSTHK